MRLRKGLVDGVADPERLVSSSGLLEPVESVAVALAVDEVHLAVMVNVVAEDGEAGVTDIPVAMPLPLVVVGVDLLEPSVSGEHVGFAVAVDVGDADAVAILLLASEMMDAGLVFAEIDPDDA